MINKDVHIDVIMQTYDNCVTSLQSILSSNDDPYIEDMVINLVIVRDLMGDNNIIDVCTEVSQSLEAMYEDFYFGESYTEEEIDVILHIKDSLYHIREAFLDGWVYC